MGFTRMLRTIAPFAALAAGTALSGCDGMNMTFNGEEGVPLDELDISGTPPTGVALGGPDRVNVTTGDDFLIEVDGSDAAADRLRFALSDGMLAIGRESGSSNDGGIATVNVVLPSIRSVALGGSGSITADRLTGDAQIVVGGSGTAVAEAVEADALDVVIGGSGTARAAGNAARLEIAIGGSGSADLAGLTADRADVSIGGAGNARFASDGTVDANIGGSGDVRVRGSARCTSNTVGSGRLICEDRSVDEGDESSF